MILSQSIIIKLEIYFSFYEEWEKKITCSLALQTKKGYEYHNT
jgi:hypothetical protein